MPPPYSCAPWTLPTRRVESTRRVLLKASGSAAAERVGADAQGLDSFEPLCCHARLKTRTRAARAYDGFILPLARLFESIEDRSRRMRATVAEKLQPRRRYRGCSFGSQRSWTPLIRSRPGRARFARLTKVVSCCPKVTQQRVTLG